MKQFVQIAFTDGGNWQDNAQLVIADFQGELGDLLLARGGSKHGVRFDREVVFRLRRLVSVKRIQASPGGCRTVVAATVDPPKTSRAGVGWVCFR